MEVQKAVFPACFRLEVWSPPTLEAYEILRRLAFLHHFDWSWGAERTQQQPGVSSLVSLWLLAEKAPAEPVCHHGWVFCRLSLVDLVHFYLRVMERKSKPLQQRQR